MAVVETESGKIQGYIRNGIFTYHGVPYAEADLFMPSTKLKALDGIRMAVTYGAISPQGTSQAEDMFAAHWYWPLQKTYKKLEIGSYVSFLIHRVRFR